MTDRLTPEREAQIRQREAEATPGPWTVGETRYIYDENESDESRLWIEPAAGTCPCVKAGSEVVASEILDEDRHGQPLTNAAFIAAARTDVPALLAELDAVRAERDALLDAARDVLEEAPEHAGCVPRSGCAWAVLRAAVEACHATAAASRP